MSLQQLFTTRIMLHKYVITNVKLYKNQKRANFGKGHDLNEEFKRNKYKLLSCFQRN